MQIRGLLVSYMTSGEWKPGDIIPSETALAKQLGVSQGTIRKAIEELVESNLLIRRQGRGTFVSAHDDERSLFHFFQIVNDNGSKILPDCKTLSCRKIRATRADIGNLGIEKGSEVICIERIRLLDDLPVIAEKITLPAKQFGGIEKLQPDELPNTLYRLYENRFGITIHRANERLRAVCARKRDASLLELEPGTPLLEIERTALALDGTPVEFRISRCNTNRHHYQNSVF
jgi:GntR family transcriptional regulator